MSEKLTGKELVINVLVDSNEPMTCTEIFDTSKKSGDLKRYARGTHIDQKKAQISSLLSTLPTNGPIVRCVKGINGNSAYTYILREKLEKEVLRRQKIESEKRGEIEREQKNNINFNFRNLILNSEVHNLLMNLKIMDENTNIYNYNYVVLDKTDISIINNNNLNKISNEINNLFVELNKPFRSIPNQSDTIIQIFRTGDNNGVEKTKSQCYNPETEYYIPSKENNGNVDESCAELPNGEKIKWTELLKRYNLYHNPKLSAYEEYKKCFKHDINKILPVVKRVDSKGIIISDTKQCSVTPSEKLMIWDITFNGKKDKCIACNDHEIAFNGFHVGHNVPASKTGSNNPDNLFPICFVCNQSMGNRYTILEFMKKYRPKTGNIEKYFGEKFDESTKQWIKIENWINPRGL